MNTNNKENLAQNILEKIQKNKIAPIKKQYFIFHDALLWLPGIFITILGGFAWAGVFFNSTHSSFKYREFIHLKGTPFLIQELPYIWIICFLIFSIFITKAFRATRKGYRYSVSYILLASVLVSLVLGVVLFKLDEQHKNPLLRLPTERIQKELWFKPTEGRIAGILSINKNNEIELLDTQEKTWILETNQKDFLNEITTEERFIRTIGFIKDGNRFVACLILPGKIEGGRIKRNSPPKKPLISETPECLKTLENIKRGPGERK